MFKKLLLTVFVLCSMSFYGQTTITGKVYDEYLEPFPSALINSVQGQTTSDIDGNFTISVKTKFPFSIQVSAFGYKTEVIEITSKNQELNVILKENTSLDEVVISASRSPERLIESPVTIERLGINDIKRATSVSFYDQIANLKGIDTRESSYGFKSFNTRGFSTFENTRFVQLVDGMDNAVPALSFSMGNLVGMSELDVNSVEILPGAASALYGANAFNGIMLMKSKNPFDKAGISTYFKTGYTSQEAAGNNPFYDLGIRMAYKFDEKFAAKVNLVYFNVEEWHANNKENTTGIGGVFKEGDRSLTDYNGLNVYGDEVGANLRDIAALAGVSPAIINSLPNQRITRTGYNEGDLVDYDSENLKFDAAIHYRPFGNDKLEIIWNSKFSRGTNIYQGANRYVQKNFSMEQHRLEFSGKNYFVRGYYTSNDSGDYFDTRFKAININRAWKSDKQWFGEYLGTYLGLVPGVASGNHLLARTVADTGRFKPGSAQFNSAVDDVLSKPIREGGARLTDKTSFYHADANYNFRDLIRWGEIQIGGSYRKINLNSEGAVFTDRTSKISFDEFGIYSQLQKKFLEERLKFTGSIRYDKSTNFNGNFSPRVSLNYALGENKDQIIRASYQTGFRNPTLQEQYFGLPTGAGHILGGVADNIDRYVINVQSNNGTSSTLSGSDAFNNSFIPQSVGSFVEAIQSGSSPATAAALLKKSNVKTVKPEIVTSYELGYRSIINLSGNKLLEVDLNGYYNTYESFVVSKDVLVPNYGTINANGVPDAQALQAIGNRDLTSFSVNTNSNADVNSFGVGIGLSTTIFKGFNIGTSYNFARFNFDQSSDLEFEPTFNTPEHKVKIQFGKENLFKNFGFNINMRWQDEFYWKSSFLRGDVAARTVLDAQINYRIPSLKSRFKIGGTNLGGKEYLVAPGSGLIGSLYYVSWTIND